MCRHFPNRGAPFPSGGTTSDTYDALGRVSTEQKNDGTGALVTSVGYTYDANGNKLQQSTSYGSGGASQITLWTYDKLDRIASMSDGTRSYTYDANGNVTAMSVLSGSSPVVGATYSYDGGNRLTAQTDTAGPGGGTLHSYAYAYDDNGNRTGITEDGTATTYVYDDANQLTQIKDSSGTVTATYTYDANHNRTSLVTSAGTTTYTYDTASDTELLSKTDPTGKVTTYAYDATGNLTSATYDPTGANQVTGYHYDSSNRLIEVDKPDGSKVTFTYDADGNRASKSLTSGTTTTTVNDVYQLGHLAYQTDGAGTVLATFTYDDQGVPTSVVLGTDPVNGPRYYYVYNGHGDVVALTDATGTVVASYSYDAFGMLTASSESFPNNTAGWTNPYRYDGRDGVRYDTETGLYWMRVRAYDPALGRFLQHDPLGRAPMMWADQPYAYAGNNPLLNVDPSGAYRVGGSHAEPVAYRKAAHAQFERIRPRWYPHPAHHPATPPTPPMVANIDRLASALHLSSRLTQAGHGEYAVRPWDYFFVAMSIGEFLVLNIFDTYDRWGHEFVGFNVTFGLVFGLPVGFILGWGWMMNPARSKPDAVDKFLDGWSGGWSASGLGFGCSVVGNSRGKGFQIELSTTLANLSAFGIGWNEPKPQQNNDDGSDDSQGPWAPGI